MPDEVIRKKITLEKLPIVRGDNFTEVYCNTATIGYSPYDLRFVFGLMEETGDPANPAVNRQVISIIMSPQHVKAFLGIANSVFATWEKEHDVMPNSSQEKSE